MRGFKTLKISDEFIPEISEMPTFDGKEEISSLENNQNSGKLFFTKSALKDLDAHIHWGEYRHDNKVEQGGYMLGNVYRDSSKNVLFGIVRRLVPVHGAEGTEAFLDMGTAASYDATLRENEILQETENRIRRIGWYHTHPGGLGVFMSTTDLQTQTKSYFHDWQFAVVLNPQKQIWRGFRGARAVEIDCVMVCDKKDPITAKFIPKMKHPFRKNQAWNSNHSNLYETTQLEQSKELSQSREKEILLVRINGESIYIGDCIMAIDTFMSRLYNSITIKITPTKPDSMSMELFLQMQIEESQLDFFTITCSDYVVNITEKEQIIAKFAIPDINKELQFNTVHTIIHYKNNITEEQATDMMKRYDFTTDNELYCIFSFINDKDVCFYVWDHDKNGFMGKLTY